ncbi:MAG: hypothetical protein JWN48_3368 [Myxococcaceae bacterium]|nr:hypothetical protein [Myxococcaceae bacterium]
MSRELGAWTWLSASLAPLSLAVGMALGAVSQGASFDSTVDTISALAGEGARDRWIMTAAFCVLGSCHIATAAGLRAAAKPGRAALALGGLSVLLVAASPLPVRGSSSAHAWSATAAFVLMSAWPLFASPGGRDAWLLRKLPSMVASATLFALLVWFGVAVRVDRAVGLSERVLALAQSLWPLLVVLSSRRQLRSRS